MSKRQVNVTTITIETNPVLSLEQLCLACNVTPDYIQELVEYAVIELETDSLEHYQFNPIHLRRVRTVTHLQQDLDVNLSGATLIVDLLDEMEQMRMQIAVLQKQILK